MEKDVALNLVHKVDYYLKGIGIKSFLTRKSDEAISLSDRARRVFFAKADLFVSIHVNSGPAAASGIEAHCLSKKTHSNASSGNLFVNTVKPDHYGASVDKFFTQNVYLSHKLANSILQSMVGAAYKENITLKNRGLKYNGWQIPLHCNIPATIIEVGFMSNPLEVMRLQDETYRELLAYGIAQGIARFLGV